MKNFLNIVIISILLIILAGCHNEKPECDYVPGQIIVGLVDTVSYQTVINFFSSLNLEILKLGIGYAFWVQADSGSLEYYRGLFSSDSNIEYIDQLTFYDDTLRMVIACYGIDEVEEARIKIEAVPTLHVYNVLIPPKYVLVETEIGKEEIWIVILERYEIVKYAELNYIVEPLWP